MSEVFRMFAIAFAFSLLGLSMYLSTRILRVVDFTCDASVSVGGCSYAAAIIYGINPIFALIIAAMFGLCAGFITASLSSNLKFKTTVSSILTFTMMQIFIQKAYLVGNFSINNNISSAISIYSGFSLFVVTGILAVILCFLFYRVVNSEYGLAMRVYSDGAIVSEALGINRSKMLAIGLSISNMLAAISGGLVVQASRSFSPNMGIGSFVFGLGAILLILKITPTFDVKRSVFMCAIIAFVYKIIIMILSRCVGSTKFGALSEYEQIITGVVFILLAALTFSDKTRKKSILHM
jgi:putative ABC transport system permease protein